MSDDRELMVIGRNADEMATAQKTLIVWARDRVKAEQFEVAELESNLEQARKRKWKITGFQRAVGQAKKRVAYYEKIRSALAAGYVIVPSFPCDIIAVRTRRELPVPKHRDNPWGGNFEQTSECPPIGEGEYKSSHPLVSHDKWKENDPKDPAKQVELHDRYASDWEDFDFPIKAVKPTVVSEVGKAMALKLFDEMGFVAPRAGTSFAARAGTDPMVIGHVVYRAGSTNKRVAFLVAWWLTSGDLEL